jgi:hypothetical protein
MTSPRLGQQLTLDFFATPTLVTRTQEPLATSALFGRIPESELDRWSAPVIIPDKAHEPAPPQTFPASGPVIEDEPARNQHNYRIQNPPAQRPGQRRQPLPVYRQYVPMLLLIAIAGSFKRKILWRLVPWSRGIVTPDRHPRRKTMRLKQSGAVQVWRIQKQHDQLDFPSDSQRGQFSPSNGGLCGNKLALNKPAFASSHEGQNLVQHGNDGNGWTRWCAASGRVPQWWEVDFGNIVVITNSWIFWEQNSICKYVIQVSSDNAHWTNVVDKSANATSTNLNSDDFFAKGSYLRVVITGLITNKWASFYEFGAFGYDSTNQP